MTDSTTTQTKTVVLDKDKITAASIGLATAGPLGAIAAVGALKVFSGKWTPWSLTGVIVAPVLGIIQLTGVGFGISYLENFYYSPSLAPIESMEVKSDR